MIYSRKKLVNDDGSLTSSALVIAGRAAKRWGNYPNSKEVRCEDTYHCSANRNPFRYFHNNGEETVNRLLPFAWPSLSITLLDVERQHLNRILDLLEDAIKDTSFLRRIDAGKGKEVAEKFYLAARRLRKEEERYAS